MKPHTDKTVLARRSFLAAAVCVPAIAVSALLARQKEAAIAASALPEDLPGCADCADYHETEHIRKYYRSASY